MKMLIDISLYVVQMLSLIFTIIYLVNRCYIHPPLFTKNQMDIDYDNFIETINGENVKDEVMVKEEEEEKEMKPYIIGICGATCSGKTTVSNSIIEKCPDAIIISQDNYYKGGNNETNYDVPEAIDFDLLNEHLEALRNGNSINMPTYDFSTHSRTKYTQYVEPANIIILEGILIFTNHTTLSLIDNKVFIQAQDATCFTRRLNRDTKERGRTLDEVVDRYNRHVVKSNEYYVKPSMDNADIILNNNKDFNFIGLQILINHILKLRKN